MVCASSRSSPRRSRGGTVFSQKQKERHRPGLAFAQEKGVHEGSQGLGVEEGGHPAGQDQGVIGAAVGGPPGDAGAGQDLQDVGVVGLKGDGKGQRGEILKGPLGLQASGWGCGCAGAPATPRGWAGRPVRTPGRGSSLSRW